MTFIDLFAGMGGIRLGFEKAGHTCLGHCEIDKYANIAYNAIHNTASDGGVKESEWFAEDITGVRAGDIPVCDCWCAGFPCQGASSAGKRGGLADPRTGLFSRVIQLIKDTEEENRPSYLFFENVKGLLSVNRGFDFLTVLSAMDEIGYDAEWDVLDSKWLVPQHRERVFVIGHNRGRCTREVFPIRNGGESAERLQGQYTNTLTTRADHTVGSYILTKSEQHEPRVKQIGNISRDDCYSNEYTDRVYDTSGVAPTLLSKGHEPKIIQRSRGYNKGGTYDIAPTLSSHSWQENNMLDDGERLRKLTPLEYWRLQGIPDELFYRAKSAGLSDSRLYKLAGNGVTVPVIYEIAINMAVARRMEIP